MYADSQGQTLVPCPRHRGARNGICYNPSPLESPIRMTSPASEPLTPPAQALSERMAEALRQKITQGEFMPGERLSEQSLSESLGISRNTLREVFRMLAKDGLVKHAPNRGVFVVIPSIASIIDIYRVCRLIECQALAQAYPRHPAKKKMREAVDTAKACRDAGEWLGVGTANMAFHMAVVELADSERLNLLFGSVLALDDAALFLLSGIASVSMLTLAVIWRPLVLECVDPGFLRAVGRSSPMAHYGLLVLSVLKYSDMISYFSISASIRPLTGIVRSPSFADAAPKSA